MHAFKFILVFYFDNILMKHIDKKLCFLPGEKNYRD